MPYSHEFVDMVIQRVGRFIAGCGAFPFRFRPELRVEAGQCGMKLLVGLVSIITDWLWVFRN